MWFYCVIMPIQVLIWTRKKCGCRRQPTVMMLMILLWVVIMLELWLNLESVLSPDRCGHVLKIFLWNIKKWFRIRNVFEKNKNNIWYIIDFFKKKRNFENSFRSRVISQCFSKIYWINSFKKICRFLFSFSFTLIIIIHLRIYSNYLCIIIIIIDCTSALNQRF